MKVIERNYPATALIPIPRPLQLDPRIHTGVAPRRGSIEAQAEATSKAEAFPPPRCRSTRLKAASFSSYWHLPFAGQARGSERGRARCGSCHRVAVCISVFIHAVRGNPHPDPFDHTFREGKREEIGSPP
jgi:hypothetical protein